MIKTQQQRGSCLELRPTKDFFQEGPLYRARCLALPAHGGNKKHIDFWLVILLLLNSVPTSSLLAPRKVSPRAQPLAHHRMQLLVLVERVGG